MLIPAICFKEELEKKLGRFFYTKDTTYFIGDVSSYMLNIREEGDCGKYQYAVVNEKEPDKIIGYIGYSIDYYSSCAYDFGAFSFDRKNVIMGKELYTLFESLLSKLHRVEFRAISGNPAIRGYDNFLKRHSDVGRKLILKDVFKDADGNFHDDYIYEFINNESGVVK